MSNHKKLYQAFVKLQSEQDVCAFLQDLLTPWEIAEFAQSLDIAQRLSQWQTYKDIEKNTGASSTTIARVAKCLTGEVWWYRRVLGWVG
jgi:TrpR-related protein YerC/YecD